MSSNPCCLLLGRRSRLKERVIVAHLWLLKSGEKGFAKLFRLDDLLKSLSYKSYHIGLQQNRYNWVKVAVSLS